MNDIASVKSQLKLRTWSEMVRECRQSGLTVEAWCKSQNLNTKTYYYRQKKIREAALSNMSLDQVHMPDGQSAARFRKLQIQPPAVDMAPAVIIRLPNATLEVVNGAMQQTVEAVLLALKSTC